MQTFKIPTPVVTPTSPPELTWDQIQKEEGVYKAPHDHSSRIIVLSNSYRGPNKTVVCYCSDGRLETPGPAWKDYHFHKTNERVHFGVF